MADHPVAPEFTDADQYPVSAPPVVGRKRTVSNTQALPRAAEQQRRGLLAYVDPYLAAIVVVLLAIGGMMVYSTTFDWGYQDFGNPAALFFNQFRWILLGIGVSIVFMLIDYHIWRRLSVPLILFSIATLVAVWAFSDERFGARRAFLNGSYQPSELAELTIVIYMAAWLSAKNARLGSLTRGLLPFAVIVGAVAFLVILQPDLSAALMVVTVAGLMYIIAGANLWHLFAILALLVCAVIGADQVGLLPDYAQERIVDFSAGLTDVTQTSYQTQQAIIAFMNGGWFGRGLGNGLQKYGPLPAPHTDSIFATIGEELGVIGAGVVIALYLAFVLRGLYISRRAPDSFGTLLAAGVALWVGLKALLNISVNLNLLPQTGSPLPFISYGGSSLLSLMVGVGLLLSVVRVTAKQAANPKRKNASANLDRGWWNRGTRVSGTGYRRSD
ncbi:MAG: cell division protein FtsW [Anaerolineae bacterium]|nr:cell division protein FtsW [Anaerolineae bacterium]